MNCKTCKNHMSQLDSCKFCHYEFDEHKYYEVKSEKTHFDILHMPEDDGWWHHQIMDQLHHCGIEHYFADIWNDNMAFIFGCNSTSEKIASALGLHTECVYNDYEHRLVILNLFQEKIIRGELE